MMTGSPYWRGVAAGEDVQPARRDDADAERDVAGIDEMHLQMRALNGLAGMSDFLPDPGDKRTAWGSAGELVRLYRRSATVSNRALRALAPEAAIR